MSAVEINHHSPNFLSNAYLEHVLNPIPRQVAARGMIYGPTDPADTFYLLTQGRIDLSRQHQDGQTITYATLQGETGQPAFLGEEAFVGLPYYKSYAEAITEAEVQPFSTALRAAFVHYQPETTLLVLESAFRRLILSADFSESLVCEPVTIRLPKSLKQLAQPADLPGQSIVSGFTQEELASKIGSTRESLNQALRFLKESHYIIVGRRKIIILDMPRFEADFGLTENIPMPGMG